MSERTVAIGGTLIGVATAVKREIVETLRSVVDMLGRYAGYCLSIDARQTVRTFILDLPSRLV